MMRYFLNPTPYRLPPTPTENLPRRRPAHGPRGARLNPPDVCQSELALALSISSVKPPGLIALPVLPAPPLLPTPHYPHPDPMTYS